MKKGMVGFIILLLTLCSYAQEPIRIGIVPHSSPRVLFESHLHVKLFLEAYLQREVELVTAKSFHEFTKIANEGKTYDMIITSAHLALLAHKRASYQPMMSYERGIETVIVARSKEVLKTAKRPLKVYAQGDISLATLLAQAWLEELGFKGEDAIRYDYTISASDTLAHLLLNNQADMVMMSFPNYVHLDTTYKNAITVVYHSPVLPYNRTYAIKEGNGVSLEKWESALKAFSMSTQGEEHLKVVNLGGFKMLSKDALDALEPIAIQAYQRLTP